MISPRERLHENRAALASSLGASPSCGRRQSRRGLGTTAPGRLHGPQARRGKVPEDCGRVPARRRGGHGPPGGGRLSDRRGAVREAERAPGYLDFEVEVGAGTRRGVPLWRCGSPAGACCGRRCACPCAPPSWPWGTACRRSRGRCSVFPQARPPACLRGPTSQRRRPGVRPRPCSSALLPGEARGWYDLEPATAPGRGARGCACACGCSTRRWQPCPGSSVYDPRRGDYVCLGPDDPPGALWSLAAPASPAGHRPAPTRPRGAREPRATCRR